MSEQYDDLVHAIRKIARTDPEIQTALGAAKQKASIPAVRGIAYRDLDGGISANQGELPDDANTEQSEEDKKQGQPTIKSDADNAPVINDDLQPGDQADKFKAYDCTTGDELALDLSPIPGQEYPAPDGWENANTPPQSPNYQAGSYWKGNDPAGTTCILSASGAANMAVHTATNPEITMTGTSIAFESGAVNVSGCGGVFAYTAKLIAHYSNGMSATIAYRAGCGGSSEGVCAVDNPDRFVESEWPSNNKTELALINGQFTASQYDPDAAQAYKDNPPSQLDVCDGNGNRYQVNTAINNSTMLTKLNGDSSVPDDGESILIDQSGTVSNRVANIFRNNYLTQ